MRICWNLILGSFLCISGTSAAIARCPNSPEAFLQAVYAPYENGQAPNPTGIRATELFSHKLLRLIRRDENEANGEVGKLDADPICDCQDFDKLRVTALTASGSGHGTANGSVSFINGDNAKTLAFNMVLERGQWRIADICPASGPCLVARLTAP